MKSFTYDEKSAFGAGAGADGHILESGAYVGAITKAYLSVSSTGAEAMNFEFKSKDHETCKFKLWTTGKDGKPTFAVGFVHAMMGLMNLRQIDAEMRDIETSKGQERVPFFKALCNKPIGVCIQRENRTYYAKNDKTNAEEEREAYDFILKRVYDANTQKTIKELRENKPAKVVAAWTERNAGVSTTRKDQNKQPTSSFTAPASKQVPRPAAPAQAMPSMDNFEDEGFPF